MTKQEIYEFLNSNPACHLATADGNQPHVRGMLMYRADEAGILFHTGDFKELCRQIQQNPKVEICFNNFESNIQVRVTGTAHFTEDQGLKEEMVSAREFLRPWVEEFGYDMLKVFQVSNCSATVWTFQTNLEPKKWIEL